MTQIKQNQVHSTDGSADLGTQLSNMAASITSNATSIQSMEQEIEDTVQEVQALEQTVANNPVKGSVDVITALPLTANAGDLYFVRGIKQFYVWDAAATPAQWAPATASGSNSGSGSGGIVTTQITKLGVTGASSGTPYLINAPITQTLDFNRPKVEVLKFTAGSSGVVTTICNFDNADATSFVADPAGQVVYDGTMHLKTSYNLTPVDGGALGAGHLWSVTLDKTAYKAIEKITVN